MSDDRIAASLSHLRRQEFRARGFSFLPRQPVGSVLSGRHGSRLRGRGLNFEELRHYRPGDDIRSLDWKVTNRTGKPHVRVYNEERERRVTLLVDQRISMFFGSRRAMKSVVAAEVAALIAWRVVAAGDRLGALVFDDKECFNLPPRRSRDAVIQFLSRLAKTGAALAAGSPSNEQQLNTALERLSRYLSQDALVIYIGDGLGWNNRSDELLKRISQHNDVIVVHTYDPAEVELPAIDELVVSDGELQISVAGRQDALRAQFRDSFRKHEAHMHDMLRRFGLPLIPIDTVEDPLNQLLRALGSSG